MRSNRCISAIFILSLMFSMIFFIGCASSIKINDFNIDPPAGKIPLRVGLYNAGLYRIPTYTVDGLNFGSIPMVGMAEGVEKAIREAFQDVYIIEQAELADLSKYGVKAIITPEIVETERIKTGGFCTEGEHKIICKWTITDTHGKILYMNTISGTGRDSSFAGQTRANKEINLAIKDMYQKFYNHMLSTRWWEAIDNKAPVQSGD